MAGMVNRYRCEKDWNGHRRQRDRDGVKDREEVGVREEVETGKRSETDRRHSRMEADLLFFMGQSNMAGRGDERLAPAVAEGVAYEYRAVTRPGELTPLTEPFGALENRENGVYEPGMKTGSMVASFVNACHQKTGRPIIALSCSKGGSSINEWLPGTPYFTDAADRIRSCMDYVRDQKIMVHSVSLVWCQGCTDADNGMEKQEYKEKTLRLFRELMALGTQRVFLIQIGCTESFRTVRPHAGGSGRDGERGRRYHPGLQAV